MLDKPELTADVVCMIENRIHAQLKKGLAIVELPIETVRLMVDRIKASDPTLLHDLAEHHWGHWSMHPLAFKDHKDRDPLVDPADFDV